VGESLPVVPTVGVRVLCAVVLGMLAAAAALDLYLELRNRTPLGARIKAWAQRYPGFMAAIALIFGAMVGHFFFSTGVP
jgi:hypothetical protein